MQQNQDGISEVLTVGKARQTHEELGAKKRQVVEDSLKVAGIQATEVLSSSPIAASICL